MSDQIQRQTPLYNQESVWDYPRPPRVETSARHIRVVFNGQIIADSKRTLRVLETSHPPVYYIPQQDIRMEFLSPTPRNTYCEFKGSASYWTVNVNGKEAAHAGWSYNHPTNGYAILKGYVAFYPGRMDACYVDEEQVTPQAGDFYGGWITSEIVGPFKGGPGSQNW